MPGRYDVRATKPNRSRTSIAFESLDGNGLHLERKRSRSDLVAWFQRIGWPCEALPIATIIRRNKRYHGCFQTDRLPNRSGPGRWSQHQQPFQTGIESGEKDFER